MPIKLLRNLALKTQDFGCHTRISLFPFEKRSKLQSVCNILLATNFKVADFKFWNHTLPLPQRLLR